MRKLGLISLSALALVATPAVASAQGITWGVKGGAAMSNVTEVDVDGRTGFVAGVSARAPMNPALTLEANALYVQKGAEDLDLDYIEVPVMLQYGFAMQGSIHPFLGAGAHLAFNMSCDVDGSDCGDEVEGTDFGLTFAGGVRFGTLSRMSAEVRYDLGMSEIVSDSDIKNKSWLLLFGFDF